MAVILAQLSPRDPATDTRPVVRVSSLQDRRVTALNSQRWFPAISALPVQTIRLFDGDFSSDVEPGSASLTLELDKILDSNVRRYLWAGAEVIFYKGNAGDAWPWTQSLVGKMTGWEAKGNQLKLTASVDTEPFEAEVLTLAYAGTGGAEGDANLKAKVKPWLFGRALNVEPVLINAVDNVYQFSAYGPIQAVTTLFERGSAFLPSVGDYASYAALVAATIPNGKYGTCLASGLVRLGAPAYGVITGDVDGHVESGTFLRQTGAIISCIATRAAVSAGLLDTASLAALDAAIAALCPAGGNINLYLTEQTSVLGIARRLARPCNAQAGVSWIGKLFTVRVSIGASAITLDGQGKRLPRVAQSVEADVSPPYWRIVMGGQRVWRTQSYDEIATNAPIVDRGAYSATGVYREGNFVQDQGLNWSYVNTTAGSGNAPPTLPATSNAYWKAWLGAIVNRQILDRAEKVRLIAEVAGLETRYAGVSARAAALGLSTTAAATAKTNFTNYLNALSPAWNDVQQDTALAASLFGDFAFPTGWGFDLVSFTQSGIWWTATDNSSAAYQKVGRSATAGTTGNYTAGFELKKDSTGAATRAAGSLLQTTPGTVPYGLVQVDSQLGTVTDTDGSPVDAQCVAIDDDTWFVTVTQAMTSGTTIDFGIYPAIGTGSTQSVAATGSAGIANPVLAQGGFDALGRSALNARRRAYINELDLLDKAISEAAPNVEVPGSIQIDANSGNTTTTTLPLAVRCKCWIGSVDQSANAAWSIAVPAGISATINNTAGHADRGVVTMTAADAPGNIIVNCTPPGYGEQTRQIPVTRNQAGAPSGGGAGATFVSDGTFPNVTSGTLADISDVMTIRSTAGGTLIYSANIRHLPSSGSAANVMGIKARYRTTAGPGAWNDFAAEVTGSANGVDGETGLPTKGVVAIADTTKTGLTASTDYDVVLQGRRSSGSDTLVISNSSFVVRQTA